ncbi:hypothetical protein F5Y01DRAFT_53989 [Xylaria sp. FL0043]|nr:hypothetical protein F5Y01DRAFT_53989 [Xylaria sp. FL0043]
MLPKSFKLWPFSNRGRDGDTGNLASVRSMKTSESTIDPSSTSGEPQFELPPKISPAILLMEHRMSPRMSLGVEERILQPMSDPMPPAMESLEQSSRNWTEASRGKRMPNEHPVSRMPSVHEFYRYDTAQVRPKRSTTRPKNGEPYPPNIENSPDAVIDGVSSRSSSNDESCAISRAFIETRKEQAIEEIIRPITQWLRLRFLQAHKISKGTGAGSPESGRTSSGIQDQPSGNQGLPAMKRKLSDGNDDEGENGEDDKVHSGVDDKKGKGKEIQRFACPYFKYNPTKYQVWPICPGPGWMDVHRVKEHLYRKHRQAKFRCARCWGCFESEQYYVDHQRAPIPCELRESEPIEGFDAEQERQLRSRKKKSHVVSEVDKWRAVFQILFPHVLPGEIPSPFYEYEQLASPTTRSNGTLTECEEFVLREIPLRLRKILTPEFDRDFQILEQSLKARAIEHTKTIIAGLFQEFRKLHQHGTVPTTTSESSEPQGHISLSQAQSSWFDAPENSMNFLDVADLDIDFSFANEGLSLFGPVQLQDIDGTPRSRESSAQKRSDSGYESNNPERPNEHVTDEE